MSPSHPNPLINSKRVKLALSSHIWLAIACSIMFTIVAPSFTGDLDPAKVSMSRMVLSVQHKQQVVLISWHCSSSRDPPPDAEN